LGPAPTKETGVRRTPEVIVANPPRVENYDFITQWDRRKKNEFVRIWKGVKLHGHARHPLNPDKYICGGPQAIFLDKKEFVNETKGVPTPRQKKYLGVQTKWQFLWPLTAFKYFEEFHPEWILTDEECLKLPEIDDHPFIQLKTSFIELKDTPWYAEKKRILFSPPSLPLKLASGGILLPRKVDIALPPRPKGRPRMGANLLSRVQRLLRAFTKEC